MKKGYQAPSMILVQLLAEDIVTASKLKYSDEGGVADKHSFGQFIPTL